NRTAALGYGAYDNVMHKYTGQERDTEGPGLDFFHARYFHGAQGRFTSPDLIFFQRAMVGDPQRFDLYGYSRNNPLKFVDPAGEKIELTGSTDAERQQELAAIQDAVGTDAGKLLTIVQDKDTGEYMVGIKGDAKAFSAINPAASAFATIIGMTEVAKFAVVSSAQRLELSGPNGPLSLNQGGYGVTGRDNEGQIWVYIQRPSEGYEKVDPSKMSGLSWLNRKLGIGGTRDQGTEAGHEFGHALGLMMQRLAGQPANADKTNPDALSLENKVRKVKDPDGPVRIAH
ncbi:MAG: RHS repeat-associated core domain-containing protein, partial [Bryobacteraceae bacterium]